MADRIRQMKEKLRKQIDQFEDRNEPSDDVSAGGSIQRPTTQAFGEISNIDMRPETIASDLRGPSPMRVPGKILKQEVSATTLIPGEVKKSKLFQKFLSK